MQKPPRFDPTAPLPRRTAANFIATGVGRADSTRLVRCGIIGAAGALAVPVILPSLWLLAVPFICLASFASWGLAAQKTQELDLRHASAPVIRRWLGAARLAATVVGGAAAVVGVATVTLLLIASQ
ncbi:MAG: hypothetical protein ACR2G6_02265 [Gemmatimonadaceae bacterium]